MIQVFSKARGYGKSKKLIGMANDESKDIKGYAVYIDDDESPIFQLDNKIRFIATRDFKLRKYNEFSGFIGGILACNYDIESLYIDGLTNIISEGIEKSEVFFRNLDDLTDKFNIKVYINVNCEEENIPDFMAQYVA